MSVTQKEIAEKLNISQAHVARALGNGNQVSEETRQRIRAVALEMGYDAYANREARSLVGRRQTHQDKAPMKNGVFSVMFQQMAAASPRNLPFYQPVFDGMEAAAQELDVDICLCPSRPDQLPRLIREHRVDGVILLGFPADNLLRMKATVSDIPVVLFHAFSEMTHCILADDYDGGRQATEHLLNLGHRRIAFLGATDIKGGPGELRMQGFLDTMREHGIAVRDEWVDGHLGVPNSTPLLPCKGCERCAACVGWDTLKSKSNWAPQTGDLPFTALICHNDAVAMSVINQARADGFEVPRDLSVVGFDNLSRAYHFTPQVTSVDFSLHHLGEEAVRLLHKILDEDASAAVTQEPEYSRPIIPVSLAIHGSTQALKKESRSFVTVNV